MKIDLVVWSGSVGGAELFAAELAAALGDLGHRARLVVVTTGGPTCARATSLGVPIVEVGLQRGSHILWKGGCVVQSLVENGTDAVIAQCGGYLGAALRLHGYRGILIGQDHGSLLNLSSLGAAARWTKVLERLADPICLNAQVAVSKYIGARVRQVPHNTHLVVIPNGVDISRYRYAASDYFGDRPLRVGMAARLVPGKGADVLVEAVRLLHSRGVPVVAEIAGDGVLREVLQERASDLPVEFPGVVHDMGSFWERIDVCAIPSNGLVESFGMTAVEAMACGRPVIASNAGGLPEVVEAGRCGLLVVPGDVQALSEAIETYVRDPRLVHSHGHAGRELVETRYAISHVAEAYSALIESLTA